MKNTCRVVRKVKIEHSKISLNKWNSIFTDEICEINGGQYGDMMGELISIFIGGIKLADSVLIPVTNVEKNIEQTCKKIANRYEKTTYSFNSWNIEEQL